MREEAPRWFSTQRVLKRIGGGQVINLEGETTSDTINFYPFKL